MRRLALLLPVLLSVPFAACSEDDHHPLAGHWNEQTGTEKKGCTINFEEGNCYLHTAPREDGTHDHDHGPFTFDEKTGAIAITFEGEAGKWNGKLADHTLTVSAADGKQMTFKVGKAAH